MKTTIIFDIGGVIEKGGSTPRVAKALAGQYGIDENACFQLYNQYVDGIDRGTLSLKEFIALLNKRCNANVTYEHFVKILHQEKILNEDVLELAKSLKKRHTLYVLSNNFPENVVFYKKMGFEKIFERMFISCDIGAIKPEKEIYEYALKNMKKAEKFIFIDDVKRNIEAAEKFGIHGIHFTSYEDLLQEFKRVGVL